MKKTIIVVSGPEKTGKTTALRQLIQKLIPNGTLVHPKIQKIKYDVSTYDSYSVSDKMSIKLGINTSGDTCKDIFFKVQPLIDAQCDIIVTAAHYEHSGSFKAIVGKSPKKEYNLVYNKEEYNIIVTSHVWEYKENRTPLDDNGGIQPSYFVGGVDLVSMTVDQLTALIHAFA